MTCTCNRCQTARLYASTGLVFPGPFTIPFVESHSDDATTEIDDGTDDEPFSPPIDLAWLDDAPDLENDLPSDGNGLLDLVVPTKPTRRKHAPDPPWFLGANGQVRNDAATGKRQSIPTCRMNM